MTCDQQIVKIIQIKNVEDMDIISFIPLSKV